MRARAGIAAGVAAATALTVGVAAPASAALSVLADYEGSTSVPQDHYVYGGSTGYGVQTVAAGEPLARPGQTGANNVLSVGTDLSAPGSFGGFGQNYRDPQDWSDFDGLQFWIHGTGSGAALQSELLDASAPGADFNSGERFDYQFTDDVAGWRLVQIPFSAYRLATDYQPNPADGVLQTGRIAGYIFPLVSGSQTYAFDDIAVFSDATITPTVAVASTAGSVTEAGTASVAVRLNVAAEGTVTVDWTTADGSATAGEDYTAASGTLSFAPGQTEASVDVVTLADDATEPNETLTVTLSSPSGATLGTAVHTLTVRDDDAPPAQATWDNVRVVDSFSYPAGPAPSGEDADGNTTGFEPFADPNAAVEAAIAVLPSPVPGKADAGPGLRVTMRAPSYAGVTSKLTNPAGDAWVPQDWSRADGISFWLLGQNTGTSLFVDILDNRNPGSTSDDAGRYSVTFTDDSLGWRYVELPFSSFLRKDIGNGAPNDGLTLGEMHGWAFGATAAPQELTWFLEDVSLTVPETVVEDVAYTDGLPSSTDAAGNGLGYQTFSGGGATVAAAVVADARTQARPGAGSAEQALGLTVTVPGGGYAGVAHAFEVDGVWTPQDWSGGQGLNFWLFGYGTGDPLFLDVLDNRTAGSTGDDAERWSVALTDDVAGWRFVELEWSDFGRKDIGNGAPNDGFTLEAVHGFALGSTGTDGEREYLLDRVAVWGNSLQDVPLLVGFDRSSYAGAEGGSATVRVTLGRASETPVTVDYTTVESTDRTQTEDVAAAAGIDYTPVAGTLTFAPGQTEATFTVPLLGDTKHELQETLQLTLSGVTGGAAELSPFTRSASVSIADDDARDAALVEDFETQPGLWRTDAGTLTSVRVAPGDADALPGQTASEGVGRLAVTGSGAEVRRDFAQAQDWSGGEGLTFWYRGTGSGDPVTLRLRDDAAPDPGPAGWTQVSYRDDFDGAAGTPADPTSWSNETGGWGWGNAELQYYTPGSENVATDGAGNLRIQIRENDDESLWCSVNGAPCEYTSGRIATQGKQEFLYGRIEARVQVPEGEGLWPAFWTLGNDFHEVGWPQTGEIDVMEHVEGANGAPNEAFATIHGPGYSGGQSIGGTVCLDDQGAIVVGSCPATGEAFGDRFHTFTVDWQPELIVWYLDGQEFYRVTPADLPPGAEWVYDHPFFLILNMAIGGNFGGPVEPGLALPADYLVDYVEVRQAPDTAERFEASFVDDRTGWRQVTVPFEDFERSATQPTGAPDNGLTLSAVHGLALGLDASVTGGTVLLDGIRVADTVTTTPPPTTTPPATTPPSTGVVPPARPAAPAVSAPARSRSTSQATGRSTARSDRRALGATGADLTLGLLALVLVVGGGGLVLVARRRTAAESPLHE